MGLVVFDDFGDGIVGCCLGVEVGDVEVVWVDFGCVVDYLLC